MVFIRENEFENVVRKMEAILSQPQCANGLAWDIKYIIVHWNNVYISSQWQRNGFIIAGRHFMICIFPVSNISV